MVGVTDIVLKASYDQGQAITIMYQNGNHITKRNIRVLAIDDENVRAYCYLRKQIRMFKRENILSAELCRNPQKEDAGKYKGQVGQ